MLGASVLGAVIVVVPKVPCFALLDGFLAAPALDCAGRYDWCPLFAELVVLAVVASLLPAASLLLVLLPVVGAASLPWLQ